MNALGLEFYLIVAVVVAFALFGVLPLWREKWRADRARETPPAED